MGFFEVVGRKLRAPVRPSSIGHLRDGGPAPYPCAWLERIVRAPPSGRGHVGDFQTLEQRLELLVPALADHVVFDVLVPLEQTLLLLNRRGFSSVLICGDCGAAIRCPSCSVSLTFHKAEQTLKCHYCGYLLPPPATCPTCSGTGLKPLGSGTQKIEEELRMLVPDARIGRMDSDAVRGRDAYEKILQQVDRREVDILRGTIDASRTVEQMHWGGGTPTFLTPEMIRQYFHALRDPFPFEKDAEISIEVDPRECSDEHLHALRELGFNRISMGVQDLNPVVQKAIHRVQPQELTAHVIGLSRRLGLETDLTLTYNMAEGLSFILGYDRFSTGAFFRGASGSDRDINYGYLMVQFDISKSKPRSKVREVK